MINDKEYWENFYAMHRINDKPSSFAEYVINKYYDQQGGAKLLELGCGNGRDAIFFCKNNISAVAIDLAEEEIKYLNGLNIKNATFVSGDFTNLEKYRDFDYIYSRFTLHSIDEESENRVIAGLSKSLKSGGLFLLEARSKKDEFLNKEFGTSHYRRYLDFEKTIQKIISEGFEILEKQESQGLSVYKKEDPYLLRIVARNLRA